MRKRKRKRQMTAIKTKRSQETSKHLLLQAVQSAVYCQLTCLKEKVSITTITMTGTVTATVILTVPQVGLTMTENQKNRRVTELFPPATRPSLSHRKNSQHYRYRPRLVKARPIAMLYYHHHLQCLRHLLLHLFPPHQDLLPLQLEQFHRQLPLLPLLLLNPRLLQLLLPHRRLLRLAQLLLLSSLLRQLSRRNRLSHNVLRLPWLLQ